MQTKNLQNKLDAFCGEKQYSIRYHFKDLASGDEFGLHDEIATSSGSVRKVAILMATMKAIHDGKLSLTDKVQIQKKFRENRSGILRFLKSELNLTIEDLLLLMITISDNTATGHIVDLLEVDYINNWSKNIGLEHTKVLNGFPPIGKEHLPEYTDTTSAKDMARLLELILKGASDEKTADRLGCNVELCRLSLDMLKKQMYNTRLPYLLPKRTTQVAHKTGSRGRQGVYNDAGIIFYNKIPMFILCVFTHKTENYLPDKSEVNLDTAKMCKMCFDHIISESI